MNFVFLAIVLIAAVVAGGRELFFAPGTMAAMSTGMLEAARSAVTLAIGLIGAMSLFLGLMKIVEQAGLLTAIARLLRPLMTRIFPEVPPNHPAMGAMLMNLSANALGLGNAATPFGIRAMQALDTLNPRKGEASNAMVTFLGIVTAGVTILPTETIALRAASGSADPAGILPTTLFSTICGTGFAIAMARLLAVRAAPASPAIQAENLPLPDPADDTAGDDQAEKVEIRPAPLWASLLALACVIGLIPLTILYGNAMAPWIVPGLMVATLAYGATRRVPIYEAFVEGAREGFYIAVRIIPYLIAILVAVAMFRASGAMEALLTPLGRLTDPFGLPAEALPMVILRSLSGSGSFGYMAALMKDPAVGPDSYTGYLVSTIMGASDTTFYVLAVYFGSVGVTKFRHAVAVGLAADGVAIIAAVIICSVLYR